jgi:hypothetical protein
MATTADEQTATLKALSVFAANLHEVRAAASLRALPPPRVCCSAGFGSR